jgi:branched-subunit amino acid transport protein
MNIWILILLAGLVTFAIRLSFIAMIAHIRLPGWLQQALRYVPAAILSAMIFVEALSRDGKVNLSFQNDRLLAALLAGLVAWLSGNPVLTIFAGVVALWVLHSF